MEEKKKGLTGAHIKTLCILSMLIDHIAAALIMRWVAEGGDWNTTMCTAFGSTITYRQIYIVCKAIGRITFPGFCYFLVEGFYYTQSKAKYALRLFMFALISEIPFDWAFITHPAITENGIVNLMPEFGHQNIFFSLLIGFGMMWLTDEMRKYFGKLQFKSKALGNAVKGLSYFAVILASCILTNITKADYSAFGILAIAVMYFVYLPNGSDSELMKTKRMIAVFSGTAVLMLSSGNGLYGFLILLPMYFYNGKKGTQNKYFFYAFYPVHILLFAIGGMLLSYYVW
ncbi:MAG: hypothetical protein HUJ58_08945 [Erysipelotrichaceae bacterium]|nr:hypothetical protein [Erysipelotrichaceae bacterium]